MSIYLPHIIRASRIEPDDRSLMPGAPFSRGAIVPAQFMVAGYYDRHEICQACGATFYTRERLAEHQRETCNGDTHYKPVVKFCVALAHLEAFRAESKAAIRKGK